MCLLNRWRHTLRDISYHLISFKDAGRRRRRHVLSAQPRGAVTHLTTQHRKQRRPGQAFHSTLFHLLYIYDVCTSQSSNRTQYYDVISSVRGGVCVYRGN